MKIQSVLKQKNLISIYASLQNKDVKEIIKEYDGKTFPFLK